MRKRKTYSKEFKEEAKTVLHASRWNGILESAMVEKDAFVFIELLPKILTVISSIFLNDNITSKSHQETERIQKHFQRLKERN